MRFVLATFNHDKIRELRERVRGLPIELAPLRDYEGASAPIEIGATLEENAMLKARAAMALTGWPAIADDTGLEIDALGGRPGVRSARYAGPGASDRDNLEAVLREMSGMPEEARRARFRTVMVACFPDEPDVVAEGVLEGAITTTPRGTHGFGYDPIFEVAGMNRTLAEFSLSEKNLISHRALAFVSLLRRLGFRPGGGAPA